jgi:hypothetical protein
MVPVTVPVVARLVRLLERVPAVHRQVVVAEV